MDWEQALNERMAEMSEGYGRMEEALVSLAGTMREVRQSQEALRQSMLELKELLRSMRPVIDARGKWIETADAGEGR